MKLIELTDAFTGNMKEYVDADTITNIMPKVTKERTGFLFFGKSEIKCVGSIVYTAGAKDPTHVKETPEQVYKLIENKEQ